MSVARGKATDFSCVTMKNMTMKGANFLEKLLDNQPVEWKKLGEVADYEQPTAYLVKDTKYKDDYSTPVLTAGKTFILGYTNETEGIYEASKHPTIIFDDFTTALRWVDFDFKAKSSAMKMITSKDESVCLLKYIYYWLCTVPSGLNEGDHKRQWISNYANKDFPIPPLSVQSRIVEILDKFTSLEAELEAELELRKKQYAYYREQLLNFSYTPPSEFNVVYKKLGEVCKVQRGASPRPITKYLTDDKLNGIPWIKIGDTKVGEKYIEDTQERITQEGARKSRLLQKGDFVLSNSMSYGRPYILGISGCIHDGWASLSEISNSVLPDYLYYYLSSNEVQHYWTGKINSGSVSNLNSEIIKQLPIPIPPLSEQARIVEILDKFDTLTNSISEGLPLEIKLRRQQYEYYREQLLDFRH